jgi:hypothetical protein
MHFRLMTCSSLFPSTLIVADRHSSLFHTYVHGSLGRGISRLIKTNSKTGVSRKTQRYLVFYRHRSPLFTVSARVESTHSLFPWIISQRHARNKLLVYCLFFWTLMSLCVTSQSNQSQRIVHVSLTPLCTLSICCRSHHLRDGMPDMLSSPRPGEAWRVGYCLRSFCVSRSVTGGIDLFGVGRSG